MTDVFTKHAGLYNRSRKKLIPCFDKFYSIPATLMESHNIAPKNCLDLGAGTGFLSAIIVQNFDIDSLVLLDQSEAMLLQGKEALAGVTAVEALVSTMQDIKKAAFSVNFDAIWSALAIHHLSATEKRKLYRDVFELLKPGGIFINADQSLGKTKKCEQVYRNQWLKEVRDCGVSENDLSSALERMKEDRMDTLEDQLLWMEDAGFSQVNVWFQDYSFNVYSGVKAE